MPKIYEQPEDEPVPPECRATVDRIQNALDGNGGNGDSLDTDPHTTACPACRERVRAARVLLSILAMPTESVSVSAGFTDRVLAAVAEDRAVQVRSRRRKVAGWLALAAAVLLSLWFIANNNSKDGAKPDERVEQTPVAPEQPKNPQPTPEPQPIRIRDEVAKAGQVTLETPKPFADSVAVASKTYDVLSHSFKFPVAPADPMGTALEPARKSLAELPVAAQAGFEPVTGTAEKAFNRFLRDVGSVKPNS